MRGCYIDLTCLECEANGKTSDTDLADGERLDLAQWRVRKIVLAPDAGLTPEALAEAKKTLAEWTDGRAEIVEGRNHGK